MARSKKPAPPAGVITVGLDVGYGYTKALTSEGSVTFPSIAGYARDLKYGAEDITARHPGEQLTDDDGDWFIGELAQKQIPTGQQLYLRGRTSDETEQGHAFRLRMMKAALGKLFAGITDQSIIHIRIATGLPVNHMDDSASLKTALGGQHKVKTDQADFIANITQVMVMPQPYGTIYRKMLKPDGADDPCHVYERTGVLDIGTYTVDLAVDDLGEFVDSESDSAEAGVYTVHERIARAYERQFRSRPSIKTIEEIIKTGCVKIKKEVMDFTEARDGAIDELTATVINLMQNTWQNANEVHVIYVAGGGAHLVFNDVRALYPQAELVDEPQLSNAQGYLNYAFSTDLE